MIIFIVREYGNFPLASLGGEKHITIDSSTHNYKTDTI